MILYLALCEIRDTGITGGKQRKADMGGARILLWPRVGPLG